MKSYAKQLARAAAYLATVILPVILGWGADNLGAFFGDPARAGFVALGVLGIFTVAIPRLRIQPFRTGQQVLGRRLYVAHATLSVVLMIFLPFADRFGVATLPENELWRTVGLALCVVGTSVRVAAVWTLGEQFSSYVTIQTDHHLVETGLYQFVRHPMYLGILLLMPGMALVFRSWLVVPVAIWTVAFVLVRISQEERLLSDRFGDEFESYRRRTRRLLPWIY
jgi:protein-S-isoprenylcysteine O-methyltransferase Ste14